MADDFSELRRAAVLATLRSSQLFAGLRGPDVESVAEFVVVRSLAKGEYLFHEGDASIGFYVVQKGAVNIHRVNAAGKEQVIHVFRTGETFAEASLATERGYPADARALESTQVLLVQKTGFVNLVKRQPEIALRLLGSMSAHLRLLVTQLEDLTLKDVETRLVNWLLRRCACPHEDQGFEVKLPGTKRALASEFGTVSETFSRTLAKLKSQGLIEVKGSLIQVKSATRLSDVLRRNLGG